MNKKTIINTLFIIAVGLMIFSLFYKDDENGTNIFFWIALLVYAVGEIMRSNNK